MRWSSQTEHPKWSNRYVRVFAWRPRWDDDARKWVWLEMLHVRQWYHPSFGWSDFSPSDKSTYPWMYGRPIVSDSRQ